MKNLREMLHRCVFIHRTLRGTLKRWLNLEENRPSEAAPGPNLEAERRDSSPAGDFPPVHRPPRIPGRAADPVELQRRRRERASREGTFTALFLGRCMCARSRASPPHSRRDAAPLPGCSQSGNVRAGVRGAPASQAERARPCRSHLRPQPLTGLFVRRSFLTIPLHTPPGRPPPGRPRSIR